MPWASSVTRPRTAIPFRLRGSGNAPPPKVGDQLAIMQEVYPDMARKIRKDITGPGLAKRLSKNTGARKIRKDIGGPGLAKRLSKGTGK